MTTPYLPARRMRRYTKESRGRSNQTWSLTRIITIIFVVISLMTIFRIGPMSTETEHDDLSDVEYDMKRAELLAERYDRHQKDISSRSYGKNSNILSSKARTDKEKVELILSGEFDLVNIRVSQRKISKGYGYGTVMADFCKLDWSMYKNDPSSYPMSRLLIRSSCNYHNTFSYDLKKIVELATTNDNLYNVHAMEPTAFVFHESRCGSTLVANALTAMNPEEHRVYSESGTLGMAIRVCGIGGNDCPPRRAVELVQDIVYMLGRTNDPKEKRLFFKIQSSGVKYNDVLTKAFPNTPWMFVYRDPVQVLMSQFSHGTRTALCVKHFTRSTTPQSIVTFLGSIGRDVRSLSEVEICALHLNTLCEAAVNGIERSKGLGIGINYENLVNKLIDNVFPNHFGLSMTEERRQRIIEVSSHYSKGKGTRAKEWEEDSEKKDALASPEMRKASEIFLHSSYNALSEYEAEQDFLS